MTIELDDVKYKQLETVRTNDIEYYNFRHSGL